MQAHMITAPDMADIAALAVEGAAAYPETMRGFVYGMLIEANMTRASNSRNPDYETWRYPTYPHLILDLGEVRVAHGDSVPADLEEMTVGECYANSFAWATEDPDRFTYVEGIAQTSWMAVRHAWLLDNYTDDIVDLTWTKTNLSRDEDLTTYYAGIKFGWEFLLKRTVRLGYTAILSEDWRLDHSALRYGFEMHDGFAVDGKIHERSTA